MRNMSRHNSTSGLDYNIAFIKGKYPIQTIWDIMRQVSIIFRIFSINRSKSSPVLFFWIPAFAGMTDVYSIMTDTYSISSFPRMRESPAAAGLPRLIEMLPYLGLEEGFCYDSQVKIETFEQNTIPRSALHKSL